MNKYLKEIPLWILVVLPYVYLATIWSNLPDRVPTHFNLDGTPNGWSGKTTLLILPGAIGIGLYLLMLIIPGIDPKKKLQQMGSKYYAFRIMLAFFISVIMTYTLYLSSSGSLQNPNLLFALLGAFFAMLGNYFQTVRPNYFIGIRTPWTLESENVWKKTHRLGGLLWMAGGIAIVILSFFIKNNNAVAISFGVIIFILVLVPIVYSYVEFQNEKNISSQ